MRLAYICDIRAVVNPYDILLAMPELVFPGAALTGSEVWAA